MLAEDKQDQEGFGKNVGKHANNSRKDGRCVVSSSLRKFFQESSNKGMVRVQKKNVH